MRRRSMNAEQTMREPDVAALAVVAALRHAVRGEVRADPVDRALYATDASIYQIDPLAVVLPRDADDVAAVLQVARQHGVPLVARGGGTSLAGQTVGRGIQLDLSQHMNQMVSLDLARSTVTVEPGIVLDELNAVLAPHGLMFAPDVSPSNRATIGGMIGNNSSGMYSLIYGKTIDHVVALDLLLSDGSRISVGPLDAAALAAKRDAATPEGQLYRSLAALVHEHADEIATRYPRVMRRVGGYNLDALAQQPDVAADLTPLLVGSEGTLALVLSATLRLVPRPAATAISILGFESLDAALRAVMPCLACRPAAIELMDDILLDATRRSREYSAYLASFVAGTPAALLQVEFFGDDAAAAVAQIEALEAHLTREGIACTRHRAVSPAERRNVLQVRKAGLPLLQSLSPDLRPETFVEDSAVPPERLAEYVREFRAICAAHGVRVAFYGHASVGLMHARPLLNLKRPEDVRTMRAIAEAIRDLVLRYGGALSGEHGDGMLRGEFNPQMFGPRLYGAFRRVKQLFDPAGLLNPGKIVDAPPMDQQLRARPLAPIALTLETRFKFGDTGGMAAAVEMCNGNGLCRKLSSGTMCPSYMVTRDEAHSTRGRANALRMVFSGALPPEALTSTRMKAVMDLCLSCKGCTGECPSRVDMTRLKAEWLAQYHQVHGVPLRSRVFGHVRQINQVGSAIAPLANWLLRAPGVAWFQERVLGIARQRTLPAFAATPFHRWFARRSADVPADRRPAVVLFVDTFADYNEPHVARAAVRLLEAAGYAVIIPEQRGCCGRPLLSRGLLDEARQALAGQLDALEIYLAAGIPIVGLEPSCILTFRDELPDLIDDPRVEALARHSFMIDEFLARELTAGRIRLPLRDRGARQFVVHGHCHQKALVGTAATLALLRHIPRAEVREIDSGCCGMAGSFGYEAEHYAISQKIGERVLFPAVRSAGDAEVVAVGTSCRHQIADGTGRTARHLVEVLADALDDE
jgi:FAD/FMN-containing dehydrogenase/Fe-S oxidoreductase